MKLNCVKICESKTKLDEGMKKRALSIYNIFFSEYSVFWIFFVWLRFKVYVRKNNNIHILVCVN